MFCAILFTGLRGGCPARANHTAVGNLWAFGAPGICAREEHRNTCFAFLGGGDAEWFPPAHCAEGLKTDEKHEKSRCLSASYLLPVPEHPEPLCVLPVQSLLLPSCGLAVCCSPFLILWVCLHVSPLKEAVALQALPACLPPPSGPSPFCVSLESLPGSCSV